MLSTFLKWSLLQFMEVFWYSLAQPEGWIESETFTNYDYEYLFLFTFQYNITKFF